MRSTYTRPLVAVFARGVPHIEAFSGLTGTATIGVGYCA
jgi:hypothetical protein